MVGRAATNGQTYCACRVSNGCCAPSLAGESERGGCAERAGDEKTGQYYDTRDRPVHARPGCLKVDYVLVEGEKGCGFSCESGAAAP